MSAGFALCSACGRHVRAADSICPFCQASITAAALPVHDAPGSRISRAAMLAGAALMIGCQARPEPVMTMYGGPPARMAEAPDADAVVDAGPPTPSVDTSALDAAASDAAAAAQAPGKAHAPSMHPLYGAPPHLKPHDP